MGNEECPHTGGKPYLFFLKSADKIKISRIENHIRIPDHQNTIPAADLLCKISNTKIAYQFPEHSHMTLPFAQLKIRR
jgi:hypothetical protein